MRRYECVVITDPDLADDQREQVFSRTLDLIPQGNGFFVERDDWGVRKLAYPIRKKTRGHYVRFDFCGNGAMVDEMERFYRIDDRVLKYMTVLLDKDVDLERLKEEVAAAQQKRAEAQAAKEAEQPAAEGEQSERSDTSETEASKED